LNQELDAERINPIGYL